MEAFAELAAVRAPRFTDVGIRATTSAAFDATGSDTSLPTTLQAFAAGSKYWTRIAANLWNWLVTPSVAPFTVTTPNNTDILPTLDVAFRLNASKRGAATVVVGSSFTSRNVPRKVESVTVGGTPTTKAAAC